MENSSPSFVDKIIVFVSCSVLCSQRSKINKKKNDIKSELEKVFQKQEKIKSGIDKRAKYEKIVDIMRSKCHIY